MSYDTIIEAVIFHKNQLTPACLGIKDGKIAEIKKVIEGYERYNFGNKILLPAAIDVHVHFREPGFEWKEDFETGSLAALHGGVSTVFDMPNTNPFTNTVESFLLKKRIAEKRSFVDFGLYTTPTSLEELARLLQEGSAFKFFLAESTSLTLARESKMPAPDLKTIYDMLKLISDKSVVAFHAEDGKIIEKRKEEYKKKKLNMPPMERHYYERPPEAELSALNWLKKIYKIMVGEGYKPRFHICHLSTEAGLEALSQEKKIYTPPFLSMETAPHYIFLDKNHNSDLGPFGKVSPPLRRDKDNAALWRGVIENKIDIVASDHAPHLPEEKESTAPPGLPGCETMVPLFLKEIKDDHLTLKTFTSIFSKRPAQIFGLNKGEIAVGRDADFMIVDFHDVKKVKEEELFSKCGWSPYQHKEVIFPYATYVRGRLMMKDGAFFCEKGTARFQKVGITQNQ